MERLDFDTRIKKELNMSGGETSLAMRYIMHHKLEEAFVIMSGMQQCPMSTDPPGSFDAHKEHCISDSYDVEQIAKEICMALTGKKIEFVFIHKD